MVGEGAIAGIHMTSLRSIDGVTVPLLVYGDAVSGGDFARTWQIARSTSDFDAALDADIDGVVIASPSGLHTEQAMAAIAAGRHALVEIPVGVDLAGCEALATAAVAGSSVTMACHTRRFSPAHLWIRDRIRSGAFGLQHLVAETVFLRRENLNMFGKPRSWVDSLLWHHAAHTIDLFLWLTGDADPQAIAQAGPIHPELGIHMDLTIGLKAACGALLTLSLSFNNKGPFGGFYRYVGDSGTYHVFRDELQDHDRNPIAVQGAAFADQDRAFIDAVTGRSAPSPTVADVLPCMRIIDRIERMLTN